MSDCQSNVAPLESSIAATAAFDPFVIGALPEATIERVNPPSPLLDNTEDIISKVGPLKSPAVPFEGRKGRRPFNRAFGIFLRNFFKTEAIKSSETVNSIKA